MKIIWCMIPETWSMTDFFSHFGPFLPFYTPPPLPRKTQRIKISKKWKKYLEISFYTSVPKIMIICYTVHEIWCVTDVIITFHFGLFFALLPPITARKMKTSKKWKRPLDFPNSIKGELHANYIFLHFALIGLEWDSITLFTKMNFFFFQNSHFNTIYTRYIWLFIY